mmetsp:Transcript_10592/g.32738  ORF Transcript_10592/g.32738 Transcript_10592/m.32738 type:complete len:213 (+) Transcript_10592:462-1100(+)
MESASQAARNDRIGSCFWAISKRMPDVPATRMQPSASTRPAKYSQRAAASSAAHSERFSRFISSFRSWRRLAAPVPAQNPGQQRVARARPGSGRADAAAEGPQEQRQHPCVLHRLRYLQLAARVVALHRNASVSVEEAREVGHGRRLFGSDSQAFARQGGQRKRELAAERNERRGLGQPQRAKEPLQTLLVALQTWPDRGSAAEAARQVPRT